ncbi:QRFP-like peptide receptor [Planococcus citri]|uniref:QRFP-like peptide receptor n=1 Tax=Planococcus citri TaxID=170843 RepID=UPI0031F860B1
MDTSTEGSFCGTTLLTIGEYYSKINLSGYADIPICFIGVILNLFNILVFTRKNMISPVNLIFTHLALADLAVLLGAIPHTWIENIQHGGRKDEGWTYNEVLVHICCNDFIITFHLASVLLTVQLTVWKYIAVVHPLKERLWCNMTITRNVMTIDYVICVLLSIPLYFSRFVERNSTTDHIYSYRIAHTQDRILFSLPRLIYGVLGALVPSIVLAVFSLRLIVTLLARKKYQEQSTPFRNIENNVRSHNSTKQIDRSVMISLTVLILFLIAEFPRGILFFMAMIYDIKSSEMNYRCYNLLISIFLSIAYINTSVTFVAYYIMSQQFKLTFKTMICTGLQGIQRNQAEVQKMITV